MSAYNIRLEQVSFFNLNLQFWIALLALFITGALAFIIPVTLVQFSLGLGALFAFFYGLESMIYNHRLYEIKFKQHKHQDNKYTCSWRGNNDE